ncbi:MAG: hypothetical protein CMC18_08490 [Flavobacteriaceae bacterium]|nr:hypothetical protein [Flavobacteriaceae bacterium]
MNRLFLVCPTDFLESKINEVNYNSNNYFYTSLGNSLNTDFKTLLHIKEILNKHSIDEVHFVLSPSNKIILDALKGQRFSRIRNMGNFYKKINQLKAHKICKTQDGTEYLSISFYLNKKVKEVQQFLNISSSTPIKVTGLIYDSKRAEFENIYPVLYGLEYFQLN